MAKPQVPSAFRKGALFAASTALALAFGGLASAAPSPKSWPDPTGDAKNAPDITALRVTDNYDDDVTFSIHWAGSPRLGSDQGLHVMVDTDWDAKTGWRGFDVLVAISAGGQWRYWRWVRGTTFRTHVVDGADLRGGPE